MLGLSFLDVLAAVLLGSGFCLIALNALREYRARTAGVGSLAMGAALWLFMASAFLVPDMPPFFTVVSATVIALPICTLAIGLMFRAGDTSLRMFAGAAVLVAAGSFVIWRMVVLFGLGDRILASL